MWYTGEKNLTETAKRKGTEGKWHAQQSNPASGGGPVLPDGRRGVDCRIGVGDSSSLSRCCLP